MIKRGDLVQVNRSFFTEMCGFPKKAINKGQTGRVVFSSSLGDSIDVDFGDGNHVSFIRSEADRNAISYWRPYPPASFLTKLAAEPDLTGQKFEITKDNGDGTYMVTLRD